MDRNKSGRLKVLVWIMAVLIIAEIVLGIWGVRGRRGMEQVAEKKDDGLCVVATVFPYYDFVRQTAGDRVDLKLIVPVGIDSHSFEPTSVGMVAMQEADIIVFNGGEIEHWVDQVLDSLNTSNMVLLTTMDHVDTVEEEHAEGMEDAHDHGAEDHEHGDEANIHMEDVHRFEVNGREMEIKYDEHIWTSPVNVQAIVRTISQALQEVDPQRSNYYQENADVYVEDLRDLDGRFRQAVSRARNHMIVVADKFPFRYFTDEYGLTCKAALSGCSMDTEPSAKTIAYLIDKVREEGIGAVYYLELSSYRTAEIISEETGAASLLLHPCHNVTRGQLDEGIAYLQPMNRNVENLRIGLEQLRHGNTDCLSGSTTEEIKKRYEMTPLIRREHTDFGYDNQDAVVNVNMEVNPGDYLCTVGEDGSGRGTLMKGLLGLLKPMAGRLEVADDLKRAGIGYLPQQTVAQEDFLVMVYEVVLSGCLNKRGRLPSYSRAEKNIADRNLEKLGITPFRDQCYRELSGRQRQRVLIARAFCATIELLILDEPITGLDLMAIQEFYTILCRLNREDGVAILMVFHDLRNAVEEASKILHLQKWATFYGPAHDYINSKAVGHSFRKKERGKCKPTADRHVLNIHVYGEEES